MSGRAVGSSSLGARAGRGMVAVSVFCSTQFPPFSFFDRFHAGNPEWLPHAKFHLIWAGCFFMAIGMLALSILFSWWEREPKMRLVVTAIPLFAGLTYFIAALVVVPVVLGLSDAYLDAPTLRSSWRIQFGGWVVQMVLALVGYGLDRRARAEADSSALDGRRS